MKVKQIAELMNSVFGEVLGEENLLAYSKLLGRFQSSFQHRVQRW